MRKIAIGLLAGAGALLAGSANASDIYTSSEYSNSDLISRCAWSVMTTDAAIAPAAAAA
jgi:hypothetical protein